MLEGEHARETQTWRVTRPWPGSLCWSAPFPSCAPVAGGPGCGLDPCSRRRPDCRAARWPRCVYGALVMLGAAEARSARSTEGGARRGGPGAGGRHSLRSGGLASDPEISWAATGAPSRILMARARWTRGRWSRRCACCPAGRLVRWRIRGVSGRAHPRRAASSSRRATSARTSPPMAGFVRADGADRRHRPADPRHRRDRRRQGQTSRGRCTCPRPRAEGPSSPSAAARPSGRAARNRALRSGKGRRHRRDPAARPLPARPRRDACSWTRSATCRSRCRRSCSASSRRERWSRWLTPVSVDLRVVSRRTSTSPPHRRRTVPAPISTTGSAERCWPSSPCAAGRGADIPELADRDPAAAGRRVRQADPRRDREGLAALVDHDWPGNVRELEHELSGSSMPVPRRGHRVRHAAGGDPRAQGPRPVSADETLELQRHVDALEEPPHRRGARAHAGPNRTEAARLLAISRNGLALKMARLGLGD